MVSMGENAAKKAGWWPWMAKDEPVVGVARDLRIRVRFSVDRWRLREPEGQYRIEEGFTEEQCYRYGFKGQCRVCNQHLGGCIAGYGRRHNCGSRGGDALCRFCYKSTANRYCRVCEGEEHEWKLF
jgi:hypothetical protein